MIIYMYLCEGKMTMTDHNLWLADDWLEIQRVGAVCQEHLTQQILDMKYDVERGRHHTVLRNISGRLKTLDSIQNKLVRYGFEVSPQSACKNLHDIVGIRIICSYLKDIEDVVEALHNLPKFEVIEIKDYITNPKPSGYRSLHVIGITTLDGLGIQCEIQLRTTAMDSWAALEHQLRYKKEAATFQFRQSRIIRMCNTS
ncbi:RelA/SpoT domain-containing protein [gut metagenome]|uniref:RelA/SpoT domain-containing protein n=1 Tax=gut metagenome TaxID=749906 RepID=J9GDW7_9ZZZZ